MSQNQADQTNEEQTLSEQMKLKTERSGRKQRSTQKNDWQKYDKYQFRPRYTKSRLKGLLREDWQKFHPKLYQACLQDNTLEPALDELSQMWHDMMVDLVEVKEMDFMGAWETGLYIFLPPEEESETTEETIEAEDWFEEE